MKNTTHQVRAFGRWYPCTIIRQPGLKTVEVEFTTGAGVTRRRTTAIHLVRAMGGPEPVAAPSPPRSPAAEPIRLGAPCVLQVATVGPVVTEILNEGLNLVGARVAIKATWPSAKAGTISTYRIAYVRPFTAEEADTLIVMMDGNGYLELADLKGEYEITGVTKSISYHAHLQDERARREGK